MSEEISFQEPNRMARLGFEPQPFRLQSRCFKHLATLRRTRLTTDLKVVINETIGVRAKEEDLG